MESNPGSKLLKAASLAVSEVTLIAPFVKTAALRKVLDAIEPSLPVRLIARWIPGEILAGVCDLEIFDLICMRQNAALYVHPLLHAKSYRFDDVIYFGSANLTGKALGWAFPSNLEILQVADSCCAELRAFEDWIVKSSKKVDEHYRSSMAEQVMALGQLAPVAECFFQAHVPTTNSSWLPKCRLPERLWAVYSNAEETRRRMVESSFNAALEDLFSLRVPASLSKEEFRIFVTAMLDGMGLVQEISHRALSGISNEDAISLILSLHETLSDSYAPTDQWEILQAWLLEFYPTIYRREPSAEIFRIGRIVG